MISNRPISVAADNTESTTKTKMLNRWLTSTDSDAPTSEFQRHLHSHVQGTGEWVFDTVQYHDWNKSESVGNLWIRGIPGCGKSVVAANVIRRLQQLEDAPVLFYFMREIIATNTPSGLLRDFCERLLPSSPSLRSSLERLRGDFSAIDSVPFDQLWQCLATALRSMEKVYCVVDALDEMAHGHDGWLEQFLELGRQFPRSIKILTTSRQVPQVERHMHNSRIVDLRLDRLHVNQDIAIFVMRQLNESKFELGALEIEAVTKALCEKGNGLFLYAKLMLDELLQHPENIQSRALSLPNGLGDLYTVILRDWARRSKTSARFQRLILEWATHSARPLRMLELAAMVESLPDRGGLAPEQNVKEAVRTACGPVLEVCEDGAVQVIHHSLTEFVLSRDVEHTQMSRLSRDDPVVDYGAVHSMLAQICLRYLASGPLREWKVGKGKDEERERRSLFLKFHFLRYAIEQWLFHLDKAGSFSTDLVECLNGFFQNNNHDLEAWIEIWSAYQTHVSPSCSILHVAAYSGIAEFVRLLLSRGATTDVVDKDGHTPLVYAVSKGHHDIVTLLLEHGASTNVTVRDDTFSWGAGHHLLAYACKLNHVNAVRALIQGGLDPMAKVITGGGGKTRIPDDPTEHDLRPYYFDHRREVTALASACEEGSTEAVLDLIRHVDPLLCKDNLLHSAAEQGKHEILSALLRNDKVRLTINDPDRYGDTPIYLAARKQSPTTIKVLLNHGADVSILSMNRNYPPEPPTELESQTMPHAIPGYTPLHAVAFGYPNGNFEQPMNEEAIVVCLDLLIDAGSKVNTGNHRKRTPIFEWSRIHWSTMSEDKFVSALLERGADASILDVDGQTPLHSSQRVYPKLAKILVNAGCNINAQRFSDGLTVLMLNASQQNHPDPIVFHKLGADFHQQDWLGNTALHHYFKSDPLGESCHLDSWLSKSNPHTRNYLGRTPLHEFLSLTHGKFWDEEEEEESRLDRLRTIDEFLKHGVSLEDQDGLGQTALLTAFSGNEFHTFKLVEELLRRGASAQATDFKGRTALHYVFRPDKKSSLHKDGSKRELAQLLINHGARVQDTDHDGNGFFKHFIKDDTVHDHGDWLINEEHAETIIELGAPILTANKQGRTALHAAATIEEDLIFRQGKIRTRLEFLLRPSMQFDINAADNSGITALHLAASVSDINVLTLIQHGADPKAKDRSMRTPLSIAAEAGQSNVVGLLLEYCQNDPAIINHQCIKRRSALHEAARSGCPETVKLLLDAGANPFLSDERGRTALHAAGEFEERTGPQKARHHQISQPPLLGLPKPCAWRGVKKPDPPSGYDFGIAPNDDARCIREVVRLLLAAGAQPNKVDNNGLSPKCVAVMLGCAPVVEELRKSHMESSIRSFDPIGESLLVVTDAQIKNIVDLTEVPDNRNELLERLFVTGNEDLVEEFVRVKHLKLVDSEKDRFHETGIFLLPLLGFTTMLKRLLPYLEDAADLIPVLLSQATKRSAYNLEMMRLLIQQVPRENRHIFSNSLVEVSAGKRWWHTKALTLLLEKGVCPETWSSSAFRSAITAAFPVKSYGDGEERHKWSDETLRMLLKHGADAKDTCNDHADSLLSTAVENGGDAWIIALLLEHGASIKPGDDKILTLAIRRNSLATVELLLKNGADPNATNDPRKVPLLEEPRSAKLLNEHAAIVSLLLRYGADPLLLIEDGSTTVFHTLCTNHWGGTSLGPILEMGIDVDTKDSEGRTALSRSANCFDVALKLIEAGADLDMIDPTGRTALHYAAEAFDEALVGELVKRSVSVDPVDNDGFTPLTRALSDYAEADDCWSSGFLTLRALLNGGANALTLLPDGRSGLHCVAPVLRDFSNKDRKEQIKEDDGRDHFTEATTLYQQFLDAGCDRNSRDRNGETPIFHYVRAPKSYQGFSDLARSRPSHPDDWTAFIETHDISPMDLAGDTLLHVIARRAECPPDSGDDETLLFKALVDSGLDPWKENNQSETALDIAAAQEKTDILGLFARNE